MRIGTLDEWPHVILKSTYMNALCVFIVCRFYQSRVITCMKLVIIQRVFTFIFPPGQSLLNAIKFALPPKSLSKCRIVQISVKHPLPITENCQTHSQAISSVSLILSELSLQKCKASSRMACLKCFTGRLKATMWHFWSTNSLMVKEAVSHRGRIFLSLGHDQQYLRWGVPKAQIRDGISYQW